ncbi:MAG: purine-binding chemotaxis protein CheW [Methanomicrobiaceae archaeon]|nr:purine-binding chemotaxis protein CheW [Methanomicrobiaceae archaeon]
MTAIDVVEFEINNEHYALDIGLTREIVEMVQITPVPRAPAHIAGIINLRGEITNIINLNNILGLPEKDGKDIEEHKIIVLVPDAAEGSIVGIIVDAVHSVLQISEKDIEQIDGGLSNEAYVKGIIKIDEKDSENQESDKGERKRLIIWLDISQLLQDLLASTR